jgi:hypothetical protein
LTRNESKVLLDGYLHKFIRSFRDFTLWNEYEFHLLLLVSCIGYEYVLAQEAIKIVEEEVIEKVSDLSK